VKGRTSRRVTQRDVQTLINRMPRVSPRFRTCFELTSQASRMAGLRALNILAFHARSSACRRSQLLSMIRKAAGWYSKTLAPYSNFFHIFSSMASISATSCLRHAGQPKFDPNPFNQFSAQRPRSQNSRSAVYLKVPKGGGGGKKEKGFTASRNR
jgi:hypothetical protein